jgi:hypothetical protein
MKYHTIRVAIFVLQREVAVQHISKEGGNGSVRI